MKITFHGAVRTVTGSLHLVETARGDLLLLDCGLFQGRRQESRQRNETLPTDPRRIKAVVLSHAHIDHIGNLPTWVARGLRCPVFATPATADLCRIMLQDSAQIQAADTAYVNKNLRPWEKPVQPLYEEAHVEATLKLLVAQPYQAWFEVLPGLRAIFHDAGHILGSASVLLEETRDGIRKRLGFTGDVGRPLQRILRDPEPFSSGADVVISESTYGDREHPPKEDLRRMLYEAVKTTVDRGGKVLIPAFALGRTQAILYELYALQQEKALPPVPVYVDSPLATKATQVVQRHPECYDAEAKKIFKDRGTLFDIEGYRAISAVQESKALNGQRTPAIIISASGMCEAGRILHHLAHGIEDRRNTILIVGFQAENTLGRKLVSSWPAVRIFGRKYRVQAEVKILNGFSGHADRTELTAFLEKIRPAGPLYLVHGDERQATAFEKHLEDLGFPDVRIPDIGQEWVV